MYEMQYHYNLQGFIYNLLKGSEYHYIHDKHGYKFFCFSNIFPITKKIEFNDLRTLIISSPNSHFIQFLCEEVMKRSNERIRVGNMKFILHSADESFVRIPDNKPFSLITGTPILVRIPRQKYLTYGVEPRKPYEYLFWRNNYPISMFISQLEDNLLKKYNEYYYCNEVFGSTSEEEAANISKKQEREPLISLFHKYKFKKQISTRLIMKGFDQLVIGTIWEFNYNMYTNKDIIQFALDSGLGEHNSLGFGFMNMII